jgi:hypothetical protein
MTSAIRTKETVETVPECEHGADTHLKVGVNEKGMQQRILRLTEGRSSAERSVET